MPQVHLRWPDLYTDWEADKPHTIRWQTIGNAADAGVRIDLYQDAADGPRLLTTLASATPDDGEFTWIPANSSIPAGTHGLRVQVTLVNNPLAFDRAAELFTVPEATTTFYVNDAATANDVYTTAAGSNRGTGRTPDAPKPHLANLLRTYTLGPTHTLYLDTGEHRELYPLVLSGTVGVGDDEGFVFTGPTDPGKVATVRPADPAIADRPLLELNDADFMTVKNLTLADARYGVRLVGGSTDFVGTDLVLTGHSADGLRAEVGSAVRSLSRVTASGNAGTGVSASYGGEVVGNVVYSNQTGIEVSSFSGTISNNLVYANAAAGLVVTNSTGPDVLNNTVYQPAGDGVRVQNIVAVGLRW